MHSLLLAVILGGYCAFSLFFMNPLPRWLRAAGTLLLFLCALKFQFYRLMGTDWISPKLPAWGSWHLESSFNFVIILFFLCLLRDFLSVAAFFIWKPLAEILRSPKTGAILALCAALAGTWGYWQAVRAPAIRSVRLEIPGLPEMYAVHLSDLHIEKNLDPQWLAGIVETINALDPDAVFFTGDIADGLPADLAEESGPLSKIVAPVYAVTGNHERYWDLEAWRKRMRELGMEVMDDREATIVINGKSLKIAGISDSALEGADPPETGILLAHRPKRNGELGKKAKLVLSGHTHGGQVLVLAPIARRLNGGFLKGPEGNSVTSPGSGLWRGMPLRLGVPAEITILKINH